MPFVAVRRPHERHKRSGFVTTTTTTNEIIPTQYKSIESVFVVSDMSPIPEVGVVCSFVGVSVVWSFVRSIGVKAVVRSVLSAVDRDGVVTVVRRKGVVVGVGVARDDVIVVVAAVRGVLRDVDDDTLIGVPFIVFDTIPGLRIISALRVVGHCQQKYSYQVVPRILFLCQIVVRSVGEVCDG
jgi:hypothetical protein